jgi:hypothetical protein
MIAVISFICRPSQVAAIGRTTPVRFKELSRSMPPPGESPRYCLEMEICDFGAILHHHGMHKKQAKMAKCTEFHRCFLSHLLV